MSEISIPWINNPSGKSKKPPMENQLVVSTLEGLKSAATSRSLGNRGLTRARVAEIIQHIFSHSMWVISLADVNIVFSEG